MLLLIDGNAIIHRAFYAIPEFRTQKGFPTNALYGFASMLYKAVANYKPSHLIVTFDTPAPTFRKKIFAKYRANRPEISQDLLVQMPLFREMLDNAGVYHIEMDGYEADDIMGTVAKRVCEKDKVFILTGDKDILQLVQKNILVVMPKNGFSNLISYDEKVVFKKMMVKPEQVPDLKALAGDPSDNYPGAKGIGPKTAASLIERYKSVENIFDNINDISNTRIKNILKKHKKEIFLFKKLATIKLDLDIDLDLNESIFLGFNEKLMSFFERFEMSSLSKRFFPEKTHRRKEKNVDKSSTNQLRLI